MAKGVFQVWVKKLLEVQQSSGPLSKKALWGGFKVGIWFWWD